MKPARLALTAAAALTAGLLASCSGAETTANTTSTAPTAPSSSTTPSQTAAPTQSVPTTAALAVGAADLASPLATRTISYAGAKVALDVWAPQVRTNQMLVTVRVTLDPAAAAPAQLTRLLADPAPESQVRGIPDGIRVVDVAARKEYLPSRGPDKLPLCSPTMATPLAPGDVVYVTCVYGRPTGDPNQLQILVPTFGSFDATAR